MTASDAAPRPYNPSVPRVMKKRYWLPQYEITVGGNRYCAPLVIDSEDVRHPAWDAAEAWHLNHMKNKRDQRGRRR